MPTGTQIKNNVDDFIINQTNPQTITRANVGGIMKDTVDYVDQEVSAAETALMQYTDDAIDQAVSSVFRFAGNWDASGGTFPTTGTGEEGGVASGNVYTISVSGTMGGVTYSVGDRLVALVNDPAQTAANWDKLNYNEDEATTTTLGLGRYASDSEVGSGTGAGLVNAKQLGDKLAAYVPPAPNLGYKEYVAFVSQSGTSAPSVTVVKNNTGITPLYGAPSGGSAGRYPVQIPSLNINKIDIILSPRTFAAKSLHFDYTYTSGQTITLRTKNLVSNAYENDMLQGSILTIKIYD